MLNPVPYVKKQSRHMEFLLFHIPLENKMFICFDDYNIGKDETLELAFKDYQNNGGEYAPDDNEVTWFEGEYIKVKTSITKETITNSTIKKVK
jgi:hypothetical protein